MPLTARVPSCQQIHHAWVKSSFQYTEGNSESDHIGPFLSKTKTLDYQRVWPAVVVESALTISSVPHNNVMVAKNFRGPSFRDNRVAGG